jgi:hypothetical protein
VRRVALVLLGLLQIPGTVAAQAGYGDSLEWRDYDSLSREIWMGVTEARALSSDAVAMTLHDAEAAVTDAVMRLLRVAPHDCYRSYHEANTLALANHHMSIRMAIESRMDTADALTSAALALTDWLVDETTGVSARCLQAATSTDRVDAATETGQHSLPALSPDARGPQPGGASTR